MQTVRSTIADKGFVFMPRLDPEMTGSEVVCRLGEAWAGGRETVHRLSPAEVNRSTPNTYSGLYGIGRFPFHTDLAHHRRPPRYFMLRCIRGSSDVATYLIDGLHIIRALGQSFLSRALVQPRRSRGGERPLMPIYQPHDGECGLLRWDDVYIQPASRAGEQACVAISDQLRTTEPVNIHLINAGDTLVVDNWRMIHGRSAVPPHRVDRVIERAYLREIGDRPVSPTLMVL